MKEIKEKIIRLCKEKITERIMNAEHAMQASQEAANSEEKSSAGDKYETSRAMGQRDRDMIARQLLEAKKELNILEKMNPSQPFLQAASGAIIRTAENLYFLGPGLGKLSGDGIEFIALSPASPLGQLIKGKKKGERFIFNQKQLKIEDIF